MVKFKNRDEIIKDGEIDIESLRELAGVSYRSADVHRVLNCLVIAYKMGMELGKNAGLIEGHRQGYSEGLQGYSEGLLASVEAIYNIEKEKITRKPAKKEDSLPWEISE